jgi:hypothetical protein
MEGYHPQWGDDPRADARRLPGATNPDSEYYQKHPNPNYRAFRKMANKLRDRVGFQYIEPQASDSQRIQELLGDGSIDGVSTRLLWIERPIALLHHSIRAGEGEPEWPREGDKLSLTRDRKLVATCTVSEIYVDRKRATGEVIVRNWVDVKRTI